jgi:hypothetical protein
MAKRKLNKKKMAKGGEVKPNPVDPPNYKDRLQQFLSLSPEYKNIFTARSPLEYGLSTNGLDAGMYFNPMTNMPGLYGALNLNKKGFNLGVEKRIGLGENTTDINAGYGNDKFNVSGNLKRSTQGNEFGLSAGYNTPNLNIDASYSNVKGMPNVNANVGFNKNNYRGALGYEYNDGHKLTGNVGYSNDVFDVGVSGMYSPTDSNINANLNYKLGTRKKQKTEPINIKSDKEPQEIKLINDDEVSSSEAAFPTNMKKKKVKNNNGLYKAIFGLPAGGGLGGAMGGAANMGTGMSNPLQNASGPLGGVMQMLNGPLAPLAGMAMNSVTDMIDAIVTPERERRPVLQNASSYTFENGGTIKIKPSKKGTFTAAAKKRGKGVQEFAKQVLNNPDNYSPAMVKKANFARNAAKWKHAVGGMVKPDSGYNLVKNTKTEFLDIPAAFDYANGGLVGNYMDAFDAMAYGGMIDPSMYMQQMMYGSYAQGGQIPQNIPVEVEGEEMYEMPNGQTGEFKGPKHENGGMPMALPEGTKIYSDRLKVNDKTMADRKAKRENNIKKLEKLLTKNPNDKFLKEALKRQEETSMLEEQQDMQMQEQAQQQQAQQEQAMEQMLMGAAQQDMQEGMMMAMGGMIKRADGSYSQRGLWDNIRANKGSGKKPTKEMLEQERKIKRAEKAYGGMIKYADGTPPYGVTYNYPTYLPKIPVDFIVSTPGQQMNDLYYEDYLNTTGGVPGKSGSMNVMPFSIKLANQNNYPLFENPFTNYDVSDNQLDLSMTPTDTEINLSNVSQTTTTPEEDIQDAFNNAMMINKTRRVTPTNIESNKDDKLKGPKSGGTNPIYDQDPFALLDATGFYNSKQGINYTNPNVSGKTTEPETLKPKKENIFQKILGILDGGGAKGKPKTKTGTNKNTNIQQGDLTEGDRVGMAGTSVGMYGPALMTMLNRMETPPNINFFSTFGQDALRTQEEAEGLAGISKDEAYRKNLMRANALRKQLVNSARGVNDIRSGQLSAALTEQEGARGILANYLQGMSGLKGQRAQLQQQIDQTRMGGEQQRDLADRQDVDQFYTNLAENVANASNMMQKQGRDLNVVQYNKDVLALSKAYSKYGVYAVRNPRTGLLDLAQKDVNGNVVYLTEDEVRNLPKKNEPEVKKEPEIKTTEVKG